MTDAAPKQKERYSRAWVIAAAAGANFTYEIVADDERGVDMTVTSDLHVLDFQLKATSHPEIQGGCLVHDLDVRTYNLLRAKQRSGYGVLALIVVDGEPEQWVSLDEHRTVLTRCAYFLPLHGAPETPNDVTVRLKVPLENRLTIEAMRRLMADSAARWSS
ncbi:DUF4365 domain-containing protein [Nocardioides sp. KC13]|uniref:DUF4365 domain-containing protein n=1 Tax=Nocardioides turkmenicus TaxID=2711220 RepID=A0A6M1R6H3_9ACTN|nr:DUF4365 domain-containing protein [Nocardioides sp. KC13]